MLGLYVELLFHCPSILHYCCEAAIYCCGGCPPLGDLKGVGMGSFAEDIADLIVLLGLLALYFVPLLVELPSEVGVCCPPRLIGCILPVVQEFGYEQATDVHMGHEVVHLVIGCDSAPMVFALNLVPFQLAFKGGDVRVWSVTPWLKEVGFDSQLLLGGNNIPRADLGNHLLDCLVLALYVVLLKFLDVLRVNGRDYVIGQHRVNHVLEGVFLTLGPMDRLELEEIAPMGAVRDSWVEELGLSKPIAV